LKVTIRLLGIFHGISGKSNIALEFKDAVPLKRVIREIIEVTPKLKKTLTSPELEDPRPNTLIIVNGKEISVLNGLETEIKDGDEIVLVPVTHGG